MASPCNVHYDEPTDRLVFHALPFDPQSGALPVGDVKAQARQVMNNLQKFLEKANVPIHSATEVVVGLRDLGDVEVIQAVHQGGFTQHLPSRSFVAASTLPEGANIEVKLMLPRSAAPHLPPHHRVPARGILGELYRSRGCGRD